MSSGSRCWTCLALAQVIALVHAGAGSLNELHITYLVHYKTAKVSRKLIPGWKSKGPAGQQRRMSS